MPATRSPTGQYVRTRRPMPASACLEVVAEAAQDLELDVVGLGERERVRDRAHVVAGDRGADVLPAAISRRVSRSKLRSLSTLASNTGGVQPFWRASTVSCSQ